MLDQHSDYYARRETLARDMAARAKTQAIKAIHMTMAERYAELAKTPNDRSIAHSRLA